MRLFISQKDIDYNTVRELKGKHSVVILCDSFFSLLSLSPSSAIVSLRELVRWTVREDYPLRLKLCLLLLVVHHHDGTDIVVAIVQCLAQVLVLLEKHRITNSEIFSHEVGNSGVDGVDLAAVQVICLHKLLPRGFEIVPQLICDRHNSCIVVRAVWFHWDRSPDETWSEAFLWLRSIEGGPMVFSKRFR